MHLLTKHISIHYGAYLYTVRSTSLLAPEHASIHYGACLYSLRSMPPDGIEHISITYGNHKMVLIADIIDRNAVTAK